MHLRLLWKMGARLLLATALVGPLAACTSTKVAGTIENEPVCVDFALSGGNMMKGSLRYPVKITIFEEGDEDDPMWERVRYGKRSENDKATVFAVPDDDQEYVVKWGQCPNPFAPKPVEAAAKTTDRAGGYACGEAKEYAKGKLIVKEGDASSRVLPWAAPPDSDCWTSEAPAAATSASSSAEAKPPPAPEPSAAPSADPSAAPSSQPSASQPSASASAAPSAAPAPEKKPAP